MAKLPISFASDRLSLECKETSSTSPDQLLSEWYHDQSKRPETSSTGTESNSESSVLLASLMEPEICNEHPSTDTSSDTMARALCPWEWKLNRDDNRDPKIITEARCLCRRSRGLTAADCVQIQRKIPVLKKINCDDGSCEYKKVYESITVGCHSVMPRTRRAAPDWLTKTSDV